MAARSESCGHALQFTQWNRDARQEFVNSYGAERANTRMAETDGHHDSARAIIAAFMANLGIALMKLLAFLFTSSTSMLSEAIHSVADTGNQGLLLYGRWRARRPPDDQHPFGYGPLRYFYAFIVAIV